MWKANGGGCVCEEEIQYVNVDGANLKNVGANGRLFSK